MHTAQSVDRIVVVAAVLTFIDSHLRPGATVAVTTKDVCESGRKDDPQCTGKVQLHTKKKCKC